MSVMKSPAVKNAKALPQVFFGLHMVEGIAEYREPGKEPFRILIGETTIKNMDLSFKGLPVYVQHVEEVDLENLQAEADGYVIRSFYNKADGKHWVEFIAVSDEAKEKIRQGWKLSNAYLPAGPLGPGGSWHGVDYDKEILGGVYEHLAIVPNPRYQESVILTPDEFKAYNAEKEIELIKLANSKKEGELMGLQFFSKKKVENAIDIENTSVVLPKSKKELLLTEVINSADAHMAYMDNDMADGDKHVMVGEEKMKLNDLVKKHMDMCNELAEMKKNKDPEDKDKDMSKDGDDEVLPNDDEMSAENDEKEVEKKKAEDKKENKDEEAKDEKPAPESKQNAADKKANFEKMKNAHLSKPAEEVARVEISADQVQRGKQRYGSN